MLSLILINSIHNGNKMKRLNAISMIYILLLFCVNGIQSQTVTDFDGNIYQTVTIGTQVWMSENLKSIHYSDGTEIPYFWSFNNSDSLTAIYGRYYSWASAMRGALSSNSIPSGIKGVCPSGWHLPSSAEWGILISYYGGELEAGKKLKEAGTTHWFPPNAGATNESGFTALPGGTCWESEGGLMGETGFWWTSLNDNNFIYFVAMGNEAESAAIIGTYTLPEDVNKGGYSVRCLKTPGATNISLVENPEKLYIYPNPSSDRINLQLETNSKVDLTIYTIDGKLILQKHLTDQENIIDISNLPDGIYVVSVKSSYGIIQRRIIKAS
jgi:uncharacterized protein (TIGR02145 family)